MTSAINPAYPVEGTPTTESVRDNFAAAKTEIEALQTGKQDTLISGSTIKTVVGKSVVGAGNVAITKEDVGLPNVDNTSDMNKPVSTAQEGAIMTAAGSALTAANAYTDDELAAHVAEADPHEQYSQFTTEQRANAAIIAAAGVGADGKLYGSSGRALVVGSLQPYVGPVATRLLPPDFVANNSRYRNFGKVYTATDNIIQPVFEFHNWYGVSEDGAPGPVDIKLAVEYPFGSDANIMQINAMAYVTCPINGYVTIVSNAPLARMIPKGAKFRVRGYAIGTVNGNYPVMRDGLQASFGLNPGDYFGCGNSPVTDTTLGGTSSTEGDIYGWTYGPSMIADIITRPSLCVGGNSRDQADYGFEGNVDCNGFQGKLMRTIAGRIPMVKVAVSSDSLFNIVGGGGKSYVNRNRLNSYCSHYIYGDIINDAGIDDAVFRTYLTSLKALVAPNKPMGFDTTYPKTRSYNFWLDTVSQSIDPAQANISTINRNIRTGQYPQIAFFTDSAAAVESYVGSGLFRVDKIRTVTDAAQGSANTGNNAIVNSATAAFTSADIGKAISIFERIAVSSITWAGNVATVTTTAPHGLTGTQNMVVYGANVAGYNTNLSNTVSSITLTVTGASTLTYPLTTNPGGSANTGFIGRRGINNAVIKSLVSASSVNITNMTGGFFGALALTNAFMIIGLRVNDGLHLQAINGENEIAESYGMNSLERLYS